MVLELQLSYLQDIPGSANCFGETRVWGQSAPREIRGKSWTTMDTANTRGHSHGGKTLDDVRRRGRG